MEPIEFVRLTRVEYTPYCELFEGETKLAEVLDFFTPEIKTQGNKCEFVYATPTLLELEKSQPVVIFVKGRPLVKEIPVYSANDRLWIPTEELDAAQSASDRAEQRGDFYIM